MHKHVQLLDKLVDQDLLILLQLGLIEPMKRLLNYRQFKLILVLVLVDLLDVLLDLQKHLYVLFEGLVLLEVDTVLSNLNEGLDGAQLVVDVIQHGTTIGVVSLNWVVVR